MRRAIVVCVVAWGFWVRAEAATLTVDLNGGADYTDIQSAIDAAADGDTVLVKPGEYVIREPINFNRLHDHGNPASPPVKNIVVKSEGGAQVTTIRISQKPTHADRESVVIFESGETAGSILEGLSLTQGRGTRWGTGSDELGGGGILCRSASSPGVASCTITGNDTGQSGYEGGVSCIEGSSPTLSNCTISGNWTGDNGGGVDCLYSSPILTNCIVWGNTPESVCGDLSHCLTDQDPIFVDPTNGDYRLQSGSPAIDAGTSEAAPTTDIEGHGRPCGAGVDIGAYEYGDCPGPAPGFRRGDANDDSKTDISDAITELGFLFLGSPLVLTCQKAADMDDSGVVDISDAVYLLSFQFLGGPAPPPPYASCGVDETPDELTCESFLGCP